MNEALGVLLTVFELFVAVALDSFEEGGEGQLLGVAEFGFFLLEDGLHFGFEFVAFKFFEEVGFHFYFFGFFIPFH